MMPRPLLYLVPTKYIFQPCSLAHSSEITLVDIIIEPYVSLGINVAVDEVNLGFALVPFSWFSPISGGENPF